MLLPKVEPLQSAEPEAKPDTAAFIHKVKVGKGESLYVIFKRLQLSQADLLADACEQLERAVAERHDVPHAVCIAKARVGIYVTIRALVRPGRKVVLSP